MLFWLINTQSFQLRLLLDKFRLSVTYFDLKGSFPEMHLTIYIATVAEVFCRERETDLVMISMNTLCLHQKGISYSQKGAV